jgi:hypothetical protein
MELHSLTSLNPHDIKNKIKYKISKKLLTIMKMILKPILKFKINWAEGKALYPCIFSK